MVRACRGTSVYDSKVYPSGHIRIAHGKCLRDDPQKDGDQHSREIVAVIWKLEHYSFG